MSLYDAPLRRSLIDGMLPWLRGAFGVCFVAYSAGSTIVFLGADLIWLFAAARATTLATGIENGYWIAAAVALIIFLGEIATAERYPNVYKVFLAPDTFYSARGLQLIFAEAFTVFLLPYLNVPAFNGMTVAALIAWLLAWIPSLYFGYKVAKWGEILLFGQRRKVTIKTDAETGETSTRARVPRRSMRPKE